MRAIAIIPPMHACGRCTDTQPLASMSLSSLCYLPCQLHSVGVFEMQGAAHLTNCLPILQMEHAASTDVVQGQHRFRSSWRCLGQLLNVSLEARPQTCKHICIPLKTCLCTHALNVPPCSILCVHPEIIATVPCSSEGHAQVFDWIRFDCWLVQTMCVSSCSVSGPVAGTSCAHPRASVSTPTLWIFSRTLSFHAHTVETCPLPSARLQSLVQVHHARAALHVTLSVSSPARSRIMSTLAVRSSARLQDRAFIPDFGCAHVMVR